MHKIISVAPTTEYFSIEWILGRRCNYDCMYCPTDLHNLTSKPHSLELLQSAWASIVTQTQGQRLPYKIVFSGGEVTADKSFLPFVKWLRSQHSDIIGMIIVTTNGSASLRYYKDLAKIVDAISFSTHSEFFNEREFFNKVLEINKLMVRPEKSVHVNVMDEFWNSERISMYEEFLKEHDVSYSVNKVNYDWQTRAYPIMQGTLNLDSIRKP